MRLGDGVRFSSFLSAVQVKRFQSLTNMGLRTINNIRVLVVDADICSVYVRHLFRDSGHRLIDGMRSSLSFSSSHLGFMCQLV